MKVFLVTALAIGLTNVAIAQPKKTEDSKGEDDRNFQLLVGQLESPNLFQREKAVRAIATLKQARCIPVLLNVLAKDAEAQVRQEAVHWLSTLADTFEDKRIEPAIRNVLKSDVDRVATQAAVELGRLNSNVEEVIRLNYDLIRRLKHDGLRDQAVQGLIDHRDKLAVDLAIQLLQEFEKRRDDWGQRFIETITRWNGTFNGYAWATNPQPAPFPNTPTQWVDWWQKSAPLFTFDMRTKVLIVDSKVAKPAPAPDLPKSGIDYQKTAKETPWGWDDRRAGPFYGIGQADKYGVVMISRPGIRSDMTFKVLLGEKEVYSWPGHMGTVFRIQQDRLYYARFSTSSSGGSVVAVDLTTGKELWVSKLLAVGPVEHSAYANQMILDANTEIVWVRGNESEGRYLELKDVTTGKTVGHRLYPRP